MTTPEGSKEYPVEVLSDKTTCRYKIWDPKANKGAGDYVVKSHSHHWHWITDGKFLTNKRRCGTCGFIDASLEMKDRSHVPHAHTPAYHATRTEQEP